MPNRPSRRDFMGLTAAGVAGALTPDWIHAAGHHARPGTPVWAATSAAIDPDLIVLNAKVYTVDPAMPRAEAFAVKDSRFVAIGSSSDVRILGGQRTQTIDAKGMTIVPGFTDCHNH